MRILKKILASLPLFLPLNQLSAADSTVLFSLHDGKNISIKIPHSYSRIDTPKWPSSRLQMFGNKSNGVTITIGRLPSLFPKLQLTDLKQALSKDPSAFLSPPLRRVFDPEIVKTSDVLGVKHLATSPQNAKIPQIAVTYSIFINQTGIEIGCAKTIPSANDGFHDIETLCKYLLDSLKIN